MFHCLSLIGWLTLERWGSLPKHLGFHPSISVWYLTWKARQPKVYRKHFSRLRGSHAFYITCNLFLSELSVQQLRGSMPILAPFSQGLSSLARLNHKWGNRVSRGNERSKRHLLRRLLDVFLRTWDLGFTAFGGPPVHFQILHSRFVEGKGGKENWVDEQTVRFSLFLMLARPNVIGSPNKFDSIRNSLLSARVFPVPVVRR